MYPIIIENSKIPGYLSWFINIKAITLFPFIISKGEMDQTTRNHEWIHFKQQMETLVIGFYALYVLFWVWGRVRGLNSREAYLRIPFEREAYAHEDDIPYVMHRKKFGWLSFLRSSYNNE